MSNLLPFARALRARSTDVERLLWRHLRAKRFAGYKFRRQQPLGSYIVDFVCFEAKLVIELDGGQHTEQKHSDTDRDAWLGSQGFRVVRFWNNEVTQNVEGVLSVVLEILSPSPYPSPTRGEGISPRPSPIEGEGEGV